MKTLPSKAEDFYLGDWLVQPQRHLLTRGEQVQRLEPRFMRVLQCLAAQPGTVIERTALIETVWQGVYVEASSVSQAISHLRKVLGDKPRQPIFIETIPKRGYRLVAPVREMAVPEPKERPLASRPPLISRPHKYTRWVGVLSFVLMGLLFWGGHQLAKSPGTIQPLHAIPVTSYPGLELDPALSPDGSQLAFAARSPEAKRFNLFVKALEAELPLQLTATEADDVKPTWSPDGRRLAFTRLEGGTCKVMLLPMPGGPARELVPCGEESHPTLSWSPSGASLIVADRPAKGQPYQLVEVDVKTHQQTVLTTPPPTAFGDRYAAYAADGEHIAFIRTQANESEDIYVYDVSRQTEKPLTNDAVKVRGLAWRADGDLIFSSSRSGAFSLWRLSVVDGQMHWLGSEHGAFYPTAAQQSDQMVYARMRGHVKLWQVSNQTAGNSGSPTKLLPSSESEWHPQVAPSSEQIVFISDRSGYAEVWVSNADGTAPRQLTRLQGTTPRHPRWAPDGQRLTFQVQDNGQTQIYVTDVRGGTLRALTADAWSYGVPTWSVDGTAVYANTNQNGSWTFVRLPLDGAEPSELGFEGRLIQERKAGEFYYTRTDSAGLWQFDSITEAHTKVACALASEDALNWYVQDDGIYYVRRYANAVMFWPFEGGPEEKIAPLPERLARGASFAIAPDARWFLFAQTERVESDIMLIASVMP